jgi:two-component system chemotaxis response regulator CheY
MQILVVDDSRAMRRIVMREVRQAGYDQVTFVEASNGAEALKAVHDLAPALVLADWSMPEMSGIELLRALRAEGNAVKLGFVTSESDPAMRDLALRSGASFMLTKPFTPAAFKAVLGPVLA